MINSPLPNDSNMDLYAPPLGLPSNQGQGDSYSFVKALIDVEEGISKFEMETLRRKRLVVDAKSKTKKWVPMAPGVGPICNELGIAEILGALRGRVTVVGRLTKKTNEETLTDMFFFHRYLLDLISLRADDWELDEELDKPLLEACLALVQDIVFSSRDGFTAINLKTQYSRVEHGNINMDQGKGILSSLGGKLHG